MANVFSEKVTLYSQLLDEKYQKEAITAFLEVDPATVGFVGARFVKFPKIDMDGLDNYDRNTGFKGAGSVTLEWEQHELAIDRANEFNIDVMDDDELAYTAFGNLIEQFLRTKVVPEIDAYRFAQFAGFAELVQTDTDTVIGTGSPEAPQFPGTQLYDQLALADNVVVETPAAANALTSYDDAEEYFTNEEIGMMGTLMFVSTGYYKALKQATQVDRRIEAGEVSISESINRKVSLMDGETPIIKVPKARFFTIIKLLDKDIDGSFGFERGVGAVDINYIMMNRASATCVTKHTVLRYFSPAENQDADAHKVQYRVFHDVIARDNKRKGIYLSKAS